MRSELPAISLANSYGLLHVDSADAVASRRAPLWFEPRSNNDRLGVTVDPTGLLSAVWGDVTQRRSGARAVGKQVWATFDSRSSLSLHAALHKTPVRVCTNPGVGLLGIADAGAGGRGET